MTLRQAQGERENDGSVGLFGDLKADAGRPGGLGAEMPGWPFGSLRPGGYRAILADPPWRFENFSEKGEEKNPVAHYSCMSTADIAALPVGQLAAADCALVMWGTFPMMPDALALMAAWGFAYKSGGTWAKQSKTGEKWAFGTGYVLRSAAEFFAIGTIGKPKIRSHSVRNLIVAPIREHSRKPDAQYCLVEELFDGPYCELFSRTGRDGWDSWGDDADRFEAL